MKVSTLKVAAMAAASLLAWATAAKAQMAPPKYYRVDMLKTKPGKLQEYEKLLHEQVTVISAAAIKQGKMRAWAASPIVDPTGSSLEHDIIGIYVYDKWEDLTPFDTPPAYISEALKSLSFSSMADYAAKRDPMRDLVRSEIWQRVAGTTLTPENAPKIGDYSIFTYLKAKQGLPEGASYEARWKAGSLPVLEERAKAGKLKSYAMWRVLSGSGEGPKYDHVSIARYGSFAELEPKESDLGEIGADWERIHKGKDWRQMRRDMTEGRTVYRSEVARIKELVSDIPK